LDIYRLQLASEACLLLVPLTKTVFLYGELDKEIYMEQLKGFAKRGQKNQVCRLKKATYGLKQASHT
jgi:hypothetical protein